MKLNRVEIKNFRSIKETEIKFDPPCRILVGINESGKSNILNALSFLDKDTKPVKKDDLRDALPDEDQIDEAYVRFIFRFEKEESDEIFESVSAKILAKAKNPVLVSAGIENKNIKEFCAERNEGLYTANILSEDKSFRYWSLGTRYKLASGWKKPATACPQDFVVELNDQKYNLKEFALIRVADLPDVPAEYLEEAKIDDLTKLVGGLITKITEEKLPDTLTWVYDEDNLLPNSIKIAEFCEKPDTYTPLKNMFILAGIDDIKKSIEDARKGTDNQFQNYLNRVAKKTTNHFRNVWKEYRNIEFSLKLNADQIVPGVKEKNTHDFARRSDGFKRFVTFLLLISVNVETDHLRDTLLLIDEPDVNLHPSGARYLRDELIKISKTNYVAYSTHSIFMIDSEDLTRHYIVKKKDEVTNIESAKESNIADEEVLYNALGHSVFSILKEKNLIFEGWNDKQLFRIYIEDAAADLKRKYKDVGICHARGVKTIRAITPMIELAKRDCLIISDSDKPAKEQQKIYQEEKGFGEWKTYQEIDSTIEAVTGEDFLKNNYITKHVSTTLSAGTMPAFSESVLPQDKAKLAAISKWLTDNGMSAEQAKDTVTKIKNSIFENLKSSNIEDVYATLLKKIVL